MTSLTPSRSGYSPGLALPAELWIAKSIVMFFAPGVNFELLSDPSEAIKSSKYAPVKIFRKLIKNSRLRKENSVAYHSCLSEILSLGSLIIAWKHIAMRSKYI